MRTKVISKSDLQDCWSASRYLGKCSECARVLKCDQVEAARGRVKKALHEVRSKRDEYQKKINEFNEAIAFLKKKA